MSIKELDYLSPKISLFYFGKKSHVSIFGSIMTMLMVFLSGLYSFYLIYNIAKHNVSNFMFYKNYLDDAGYYIFNDTGGIFHYFQLYDYQNQVFGKYNSKYIRIFMSRIYYKNYEKESLSKNEHWVYDLCRDGIDNKNIPKEIFEDNQNFNIGVCLRYYYDNIKRKYFPIEDKQNFKYPYLIHGSGRRDNLLLETVVERCNNESIISDLLGPCGDEKAIEDYLDIHKAIYFQLLENQVNTENYKKSIYHYIYSISGSLNALNVPVNNVNLMPFIIEIKKGIILPKVEKLITYIFDDNRKATFETNNKYLMAIFDYWLVNSCQVIKGEYNNLYDILPNIGGIIQLIYYIFYSFNYLYNKYIIIADCNKLFFQMFHRNAENEDSYNRKIFINCVNSIKDELKFKRNNSQIKRKSRIENKLFEYKAKNRKARNNKLIKTDINSNKNVINYINNKNEFLSNSNNISNSNELIMEIPKNDVSNTLNVDIPRNKNFFKINKNEKINKINNKLKNNKKEKMNFLYYHFNYQLQEYIFHKNNEFKYEPLNQNIISKFISFYNYILSLMGNKNKKRIFFIFNKFREKILGEENLFRVKISLYHLEKYFNIRRFERIDILELYKN